MHYYLYPGRERGEITPSVTPREVGGTVGAHHERGQIAFLVIIVDTPEEGREAAVGVGAAPHLRVGGVKPLRVVDVGMIERSRKE